MILPKPKRLRGCRAKGITFERRVEKFLKKKLSQGDLRGQFHPGQWIEFEDSKGLGYAQPDFYIVNSGGVLLLECKLSQTDTAWDQLYGLYKPLLEHIYKVPVVSVQVCKNLRQADPRIISDFKERKDGAIWNYIH